MLKFATAMIEAGANCTLIREKLIRNRARLSRAALGGHIE